MGIQLGFGNQVEVPEKISDEWPWYEFEDMDLMSLWVNSTEPVCAVGMKMNEEQDTTFCGFRLLNCEEKTIQSYSWGGPSCSKS